MKVAKMKAARAVKAARKSMGLSQAQLADRLNVALSTVAGWELGDHGIRGSRLAAVAKELRCSVTDLVEA